MIDWLDANLVTLLLTMPLVGAFFASLLPGDDKVTLRHVGLGASLLTALLALRAAFWVMAQDTGLHDIVFVPGLQVSFPVYLDKGALAPLLCVAAVVPMAMRGGAPRSMRFIKAHVLLILALETLLFAVMVIEHALASFTFLAAATYPLLILHSLFGGQFKGARAYRIAAVLCVADALTLVGIGILYVPQSTGAHAYLSTALGPVAGDAMLFGLLLAASATRIGLVPFTDWLTLFLQEAPTTVKALFVGALMPVSVFFAIRWGVLVMPDAAVASTGWIAAICLGTAVVALLHAWVETDVQRFWAFSFFASASVVFLAATTGHAHVMALAQAGAASAGMSAVALCFVIDAVDRRFLTTESKELFGLSTSLPTLWRVLVFAGAAMCAVPLLGFGLVLYPLLFSFVGAVDIGSEVPRTTWLWVAVGYIGVFAGMALAFLLHIKQMLHLPEHKVRPPAPLSLGQSARLFIPIFFALFGSAFVLHNAIVSAPPPKAQAKPALAAGAEEDVNTAQPTGEAR